MIRRLLIEGHTSLAQVEMRDLGRLVLIFGPNASGKSNLLDALDLLGHLGPLLRRTLEGTVQLDGDPALAERGDHGVRGGIAFVRSDGDVQVLVNAAGGLVGDKDGTLTGLHRAWLDDLAGNLLTAVLLTEALLRHLSSGARVVTIGSIAGSRGAGSYGAAKAALVAWNASLARQLAQLSGTANVVVPGMTETTLLASIPQGLKKKFADESPTGKLLQPVDVAKAIVFLSSDWARAISGQSLILNQGELFLRY